MHPIVPVKHPMFLEQNDSFRVSNQLLRERYQKIINQLYQTIQFTANRLLIYSINSHGNAKQKLILPASAHSSMSIIADFIRDHGNMIVAVTTRKNTPDEVDSVQAGEGYPIYCPLVVK